MFKIGFSLDDFSGFWVIGIVFRCLVFGFRMISVGG